MEENQKSEYRYHAFISYRHADNKNRGRQWATWLHQALETYEVPKDLVGQINGRGELIPDRIYPVFRDEEELPAHSDLAHTITEALEQTNLLVVLCSPRAVTSTYVADEISYFKRLGRSDRIIAAIIDGEPNASWDPGKHQLGFSIEDECFPLPLQFEFDEYGQQTEKHAEPIAADFRVNHTGKTEEGWTTPAAYREYLKQNSSLTISEIEQFIDVYEKQTQLMLLKVIAGILGVPLGDLTQRDKAYQLDLAKKKQKQLRRWVGVVSTLAALSMGSATYAYIQKNKAESFLSQIRSNLHFINNDIRDAITGYAPQPIRNTIIPQISKLQDVIRQTALGSSNPADILEVIDSNNTKMAIITDNKDYSREQISKILEENLVLINRLIQLEPESIDYQFRLSLIYYQFSRNSTDGNSENDWIEKAIKIYEHVSAKSSYNDEYLTGFARYYEYRGDIYLRKSNYNLALKDYQHALVMINKSISLHPNIESGQEILANIYRSLTQVSLFIKDGESDAIENANKSYAIFKKIAENDPANMNKQKRFAAANMLLGDVYFEYKNHLEGIKYHKIGLDIYINLAHLDPDSLRIQQLLAIGYNSLGSDNALIENHSGSFEYINKALGIYQMLVKANPEDASIQRELARQYYRMYLSTSLSDNSDAAVKSLEMARDLNIKILGKNKNDENALSSLIDINRSLSKESLITDEELSYLQAALDLAKKLVAINPNDLIYQGKLFEAYSSLGDFYRYKPDYAVSISNYNNALMIAKHIAGADSNSLHNQYNLARIYSDLGYVYYKLNNNKDSLNYYLSAKDIVKNLIKQKPIDVVYLSKMSDIYEHIALSESKLGNLKEALVSYEEKLSIEKKRVDLIPNNKDYLLELHNTYDDLGQTQMNLGLHVAALDSFRHALDVTEALLKLDPNNDQYNTIANHAHKDIAEISVKDGNDVVALTHYYLALVNMYKLNWSSHYDSDIEAFSELELKNWKMYRENADKGVFNDNSKFGLNTNETKINLLGLYKEIGRYYYRKGDYSSSADIIMAGLMRSGINLEYQKCNDNVVLLNAGYGNYMYWSWVKLFSTDVKSIPPVINSFYACSKTNEIELKSNLGHAYLISGNYLKAKQIYSQYKGYTFPDGQKWDELIIDDFKALKKSGITTPDFSRIAKEVFGVNLSSKS